MAGSAPAVGEVAAAATLGWYWSVWVVGPFEAMVVMPARVPEVVRSENTGDLLRNPEGGIGVFRTRERERITRGRQWISLYR